MANRTQSEGGAVDPNAGRLNKRRANHNSLAAVDRWRTHSIAGSRRIADLGAKGTLWKSARDVRWPAHFADVRLPPALSCQRQQQGAIMRERNLVETRGIRGSS